MRRSISLDRQRTALLLIDFQEEQRSDPLYAVSGFDTVLARAHDLFVQARHHGLRVIHVAYRRDFAVVPPRPFEPATNEGGPTFSNIASPSTEICAEVARSPGESVIYKNDATAFSEGSLLAALRQAKVEWLIVAGVWSEACIAASVRDAIAAGLHLLLVKDACGSGSQAMHETAILNLANRLYGGAIADTARACALIAGKEAEVWVPERPVPILFSYDTAHEIYRSL